MNLLAQRTPGVADVLTLGNALCGLAAIMVGVGLGPFEALSPSGQYSAAALLLLAGTVFDVVDGAAARRWGGTPLGATLDCLADAISFGVAPVVVVIAYVGPAGSTATWLMLAVGAVAYVAAALIRLADFAVHRRHARDFVGLPTTSACIAAIALGYLSPAAAGVAAGLVGIAVLMLSPLVYPAGSRMVTVLISGWVMGALAIVGVVDIGIAAAVTLAIICLVVPLTTTLLARAVAGRMP